MGIAIGCSESSAFDLGEILEPPDALGTDRLVTCVNDHVASLGVIAVEFLPRRITVLFDEADAADRIGVQQLLVCRHDLAADLIVVWGNCADLMFHNLSPLDE